MDEKFHIEWADEIASGRIFDRVPFYRAPAYPYMLGLVRTISAKGYLVPRLPGILFGSLSCALIFLIGQAVFSRKVGALAGILMALYPMLLYYDSTLLTVSLEVLSSLLAFLFLLQWLTARRMHYLMLTGLATGLAVITRPNFAIFIPLLIILFAWNKAIPARERLRAIVVFSIGALFLVTAVTFINAVVGKDFVVVASNGGINFFFGNNPAATGWTAFSPEIHPSWWGGYRDAIMVAQRAQGKVLRPSQVSGYWFSQGVHYIVSAPREWLGLMVKKMYLFLNAFELSNNQSIDGMKKFSPLLNIPFLNYGVILALAVWGGIVSIPMKRARLCIWYIALYALTLVAFFITARYRMPVVPMLLVLASAGIIHMCRMIKSKRFKQAAISIPVVAGVFIFSHTDFYGTHVVSSELEHMSLGNRYFARAQYEKAEAEYKAAIACNPRMWEAMNALGNAYLAREQYDEALSMFDSSLAVHVNIDALCKKGIYYSRQGDRSRAEQYLLQALAVDDEHPEVFYYIGLHYLHYNEPAKALASLKQALFCYPDPEYLQSINYNIGRIYVHYDQCDSAYIYLSKIDPQYQDTRQLLETIRHP